MSNQSFRDRVAGAKKGNPIWKPEEGDFITGAYGGLREVTTKKGKSKILDMMNDETGEEVSVWATTVIVNKIEELQIQVGETIGLKYLGMTNNYHDWIVEVDREEKEDGD